ncbi:unnamed protein product, partial [Prorocentrum cordatum]
DYVESIRAEVDLSDDPILRLPEIKSLAFAAKQAVLDELAEAVPVLPIQKISWMLATQRAITRGDRRVLRKACRGFPELLEFVDIDAAQYIDFDKFHQLMNQLNSEHVDAMQGENLASDEAPSKKQVPERSAITGSKSLMRLKFFLRIFHEALYELYEALLAGAKLPDQFNLALSVFLPKGTEREDQYVITRQPSVTRPIALSNTDNKILSKMIGWYLAPIASVTVDHSQRGFVGGRQLAENIIELEAVMLRWVSICGEKEGGHAFFDVASAFPSLAHSFIFAVLREMALPPAIVWAIRELYRDISMIVSFRGVQEFMIRCARGVKQGCPLSGLIWALCFDPIIRKMKFELSGFQVRLGVFADDLGLAARHFFQCFPVVMKEFALVLQAAGLKVNTHKTYIIIYADLTKAQVLEKMNAAGVEGEDFKIVAAARYLGLFLGFNSAEASWAHPIAEFRKRIYHVKSLKLGLLASLSAYNMVCFSVLSFVGQFLPPPQEALRTVREGLQSLTNGPRHAFPPLVLQHLKEIGAPVEPRHLELECRAAAYRLAVRSPQVYLERLAWEEAEADDERVLAPKYRAWVNQSIFMHLSKVQEELEVVHRCPYDHVESNLQRKVYKLLYSRSQIPSMPQLLLPRLQHFDPSATIADADRMFLNISTLARDLPFFITTAQLRSICNG